jgi:hypothetical protein
VLCSYFIEDERYSENKEFGSLPDEIYMHYDSGESVYLTFTSKEAKAREFGYVLKLIRKNVIVVLLIPCIRQKLSQSLGSVSPKV